jgi:hypothetical protein
MNEPVSNARGPLLARLTSLTAQLMDLHDVRAETVLMKLDRNAAAIAELRERLLAVVPFAVPSFDAAVHADEFRRLVGRDDADAVFDELNRRTARLLGIKCVVATTLHDSGAPGPPTPTGVPR